MRKIRMLFAGVVAAMSCNPAWTQSPASVFPTKPVTIVIPFSAGGPSDVEARLYQPRLMEAFGQSVIFDHKPGAGGSIGCIYVAKAAPDGHTLVTIGPSFTVYPAFFPADKLPYDPNRDFAPVSMVTKRSTLLLAHPSLGARNFQEYLAYARANPDKVNFGTIGSGGIFHIVGAWLHGATSTRVTFVHYKGAGPMQTDLIAGRVGVGPSLMFAGLPHVKSGKLIPLAVMSAESSKYLPEIRTIADSGVPGFDYTSWSGYFAPARTPEAIVNRLSAEFAKIAKTPDIIKRMDADGAEMVGSTPEYFRQVLLTDTARWRRLVQENGIKLEE